MAVDANGKQSLASEAGSCNGKHPSDWVVGNRTDISWTAVEGATEYNIYREEAGYYGFIGVSSGTTFSDNNYQADTADTPREDWDPFADGNNPSVGGLPPAAHGPGGYTRQPAGLLPFA